MTRVATIILFVALVCNTSFAADDSPALKDFSSGVVTRLKQMRLAPTTSEDGKNIRFKSAEENYVIFLNEDSITDRIFVEMRAEECDVSDMSQTWTTSFCNSINKGDWLVKAYYQDDRGKVIIAIEMLCHKVDDFKYIIKDCIKKLAEAKQKLRDGKNKDLFLAHFSIRSENESTIVSDFGQTIYAIKAKFITIQPTLSCKKPGKYRINFKLFNPNMDMVAAKNQKYTATRELNLRMGDNVLPIKVEHSGANYWKQGTYKCFIYSGEQHIGTCIFTMQ